jgi:predicted ATPase/DNA-binding SARP family transcriptional activator
MRYRLLGSLAAERDDGLEVPIAAPQQRALLAFLLLQRGRPVSRERVIDALWGEEAPPAATESLFALVSRLRGKLGSDAIRSVPAGYEIPLATPEAFDILAFEADVARGRRAARAGQWPAADAAYRRALEHWRGPALADFRDEAFARAEATGLEEQRLSAIEERMQARIELGCEVEVIPELDRLVTEHPLRERLWGQLMLALYRAGRQADALARYRDLRRVLRDELGLDPSPASQELQLRVLRHDPSLGGPVPAERNASNLPPSFTTFVGRQAQLEQASGILADHRLLTLTGPGGVGKTRLAVRIAELLLPEYPGETQFVDISAVRDPGRVLERIGSVVGGGSRPDEAIGLRRMQVVLDNFEQVLEAAGAIADLLARCPNLRLIVTSRAPLRIAAERQLEVPPLDLPEAAALFLDRAQAAKTELLEREEVLAAITGLDGLPLALELAAARVKSLSVATMRTLLEDRQRFLTAGRRDAPERHRTLRDTIQWSYALLTPRSQEAFRRLAVPAPGFDLQAAMAIGEAGVDEVADLVDHSLLRRVGDRYAMLETIRAFADEVTGEEERAATRERHMRHFAALPLAARLEADAQGATGIETPAHDIWLQVCATNQDNLRLAFEHAVAVGNTDATVTLFRGISIHWVSTGVTEESVRWARLALEAARDLPPPDLEHVRFLASDFARYHHDFEWAIELLELVLEAASDRGDLVRRAYVLDDLAGTYALMDRYEEAWRFLALAHETHRQEATCEPRHLAHTLGHEVLILLLQGRVREAEEAGEALRAAHEASSPTWLMRMIEVELYLAEVAAAAHRDADARRGFELVLAETTVGQYRHYLADTLDGLAGLDRADHPEHAARLLGMAERVRAEMQEPIFFRRQRAALVREVQARLGPGAYESARRDGMAVPLSEMAAAALVSNGV